MEQNCVSCHNPHSKDNGKYRLDDKTEAFKPHKKDNTINPGHPEDSLVYSNTQLPLKDDSHMPPQQRDQLTKEQTDVLKRWIAEGATWPDGVTLKAVQRINFARDIVPILGEEGPLDGKAIETLRLWLNQGATWPAEFKFGNGKTRTLPPPPEAGKKLEFAKDIEPILAVGGPLSDTSKAVLISWVAQGAPWPAGITVGGGISKKMQLVNDIYKIIVTNSPEKTEADMKAYTNTIPGTKVAYAMVPIPGGEFLMGSPDSEASRKADEGPQHKVKIEPFWMEQCEVTWNEYELFMYPDENRPSPLTNGTTNYTGDAGRRRYASDQAVRRDEFRHGQGRLSGHQHDAARLQYLLPVAQRQDRPFLPAADGGRVGIRLPRRHDHRLFLRRRSGQTGRIRLVRGQQRLQVSKGRQEKAQSVGPVRHAGQRGRMDAGPIRPELLQAIHRDRDRAMEQIRPRLTRRWCAAVPGRMTPDKLRCACRRGSTLGLENAGPAIAQEHLVSHRRASSSASASSAR